MEETWSREEHGNEFAAAHTGDLRRNFLADETDLIPLRGGARRRAIQSPIQTIRGPSQQRFRPGALFPRASLQPR